MGPAGNIDVSRTHSLFVDDLKVYHESHEMFRDVNEVIVYRQVTIMEHVMMYRNVQRSYSNVERWSREKD